MIPIGMGKKEAKTHIINKLGGLPEGVYLQILAIELAGHFETNLGPT